MSESINDQDRELEQKIDAEMLSLFRDQLKAALSGTFVCIIATNIIFWQGGHNSTLHIWTAAMLVLITFRISHARTFPAVEQLTGDTSRWKRTFAMYSLLAGICWGMLPFIFDLNSPVELTFLTLLSCGLIAGAIASLSLHMPAYYCFSFPIVIPLSLYYFSLNDLSSISIAIMLIVFISVTLYAAHNSNSSFKSSLNIRYQNLKLIEQLRKQALALTEERNNAERANAEKSRFLAAASHDLRQPLHSLGLFLGAMESHLENPSAIDLLGKSNKSLQSLEDLFSSLLDISKLDAGAIDILPIHFKISSVVQNIKDQLEGIASKQQVGIRTIPSDSTVFCDPILIARCLRNLVINAIQHAECNEIIVCCKQLEHDVEIMVMDDGKGIPDTEIDNIFNEFHQLNNPERDRRKGLGLGLTIVKRLCELQNHDLKLSSKVNKGTELTLTVPGGKPELITDIQQQHSNNTDIKQSKSILVIDDEEPVLDGIKIVLTQWNQSVHCAATIETAVNILNEGFEPQIIISDYRLQDNKTGTDAIQTLTPLLSADTQVIFITGDTSPERIIEARQSGYPLIHKPLQPVMLKMILNRLCDNPDLGKLKTSENTETF
ncbi:MAG: ATP-binding protein [Arenicella sp.]